ncbi:MAG TPA: (4Fe-4S)-binding protein [Flavobacterium sp.]|nr:(4Fe-4S)-binding protein [Flavobacterium sp.]
MDTIKEYSNGEVTIIWKPELCIHSAICARGLPHVFQPHEKPWVKQHAATSEEIMTQVSKCPSGALSFYKNNDKKENNG